jgi:hypothetical protein
MSVTSSMSVTLINIFEVPAGDEVWSGRDSQSSPNSQALTAGMGVPG